MNPIEIIQQVFRAATQPVPLINNLAADLQHWYLTHPENNYLQPCVIDGKAALVCQKQLSSLAPEVFQSLNLICEQYGIFLKEDTRAQIISHLGFTDNRRKMAVVLTFCLTVASSAHAATVSGSPFPAAPSIESVQPIHLTIKNQTLSDVVRKISIQTGIQFKFDAAVENDLINQKLNAQDWNSVLGQLLQRYNYSTIQEHHAIKTVLITGYRGGVKPYSKADIRDNTLIDTTLDDSVDLFDNQVAMDIEIPIDQLTELPEGGDMTVDLPVGAFKIKQKSMMTTEDGTLCWEGMLKADNAVYQLYLAKTLDGVVTGNVYAPDGLFYIETINGQIVMVKVDHRPDQISLR